MADKGASGGRASRKRSDATRPGSAEDRARVEDLERRLAAVEARLRRAESALVQATAPPPPSAMPLPPASAPGTVGWVTVRAKGSVAAMNEGWAPAPGAASPFAAAPASAAPPSATAPRTLDAVLGANWLARAGMLLLALGVVFFLRLAYDRGWVPIEGRYAVGLVGGFGLWLAGDLVQSRGRTHPAFTQVLSGGGAVIAYVTLYVGYSVDAYRDALGMTLPIVLALLAAVSVLLAAYAIWRDLPVLGGVAAGLATILLAPAGDFSTAGILYAAFLDTGIIMAATFRRWDHVTLTALVAGNVVIWAGFAEDLEWQLLLACALVINGAGLAASAVTRAGPRILAMVEGGLAIVLLAAATAAALDAAEVEDPAGWALLSVGALGLALTFVLTRPGPGIGLASTGLLVLWPVLQFQDDFLTPLVHAGLAILGLAFAAFVPRVRLAADVSSVAASAVGLVAYWAVAEGGADNDPLALALASGALLTAAALVHWGVARSPERRAVGITALVVGLLALFVVLSTVLTSWTVTVSWAVVAVAAVALGLAARVDDLRLAAFGLFALVLVRIFVIDLSGLGVVARVVAFLLTGTLLLVAAFMYARARKSEPGPALRPPVRPG